MRKLTLPLALLAVLALAASAVAATNASKFDLSLSTKKTEKSTSFKFDVAFANTGGNAVPAALNKFSVSLPKGSKFNHAAASQCKATEQELTQQGSANACPRGSEVGSGTATAVPPAGGATIKTTVKIYNMTGKTFLFQFQLNGADAARFGAKSKGSTLTSETLTGTLPGDVIVTSFKGKINKKSSKGKNLITTPKKCPKSKKWKFSGNFKFADGTHKPTDTVACRS